MLSGGRRADPGMAGVVLIAVAAVGCCALVPLVGGLVGGLTLGAVLGLGLGVIALGTLAWAAGVAVTDRRRRPRCDSGVERR